MVVIINYCCFHCNVGPLAGGGGGWRVHPPGYGRVQPYQVTTARLHETTFLYSVLPGCFSLKCGSLSRAGWCWENVYGRSRTSANLACRDLNIPVEWAWAIKDMRCPGREGCLRSTRAPRVCESHPVQLNLCLRALPQADIDTSPKWTLSQRPSHIQTLHLFLTSHWAENLCRMPDVINGIKNDINE